MNCPPGGGSCSLPGTNLAHGTNQRVGSAPTTYNALSGGTPAVPPRPATSTVNRPMYYSGPSISPYYGGMGGYGSYYGSGYSGMYGGYGGQNNTATSSELEQSWRQAFSTIESIVRTCSSVTMMLDSTYFAVFNCFRAVIGLGEHFSDVKAQLGRILQAFPFVRWALNLLRFLLRLVGLSHLLPVSALDDNQPQTQQQLFHNAWATSTGDSPPVVPGSVHAGQKGGLWSLIYFALVFGLPWLLWKLMSLSIQRNVAKSQWFRQGTAHPVALAQFDFHSDSTDELSFLRGAKVHLAPLEQQPHPKSGWLLATVDGKTFGMVPKNYLAPPTITGTNSNNRPNPATFSDQFKNFNDADLSDAIDYNRNDTSS